MAPLQPTLLDCNELASDLTVRLEYDGEVDRFRLLLTMYQEGRRTSAQRWLVIEPGGDYGHLSRAVASVIDGWLYDPGFSVTKSMLDVLVRVRWPNQ